MKSYKTISMILKLSELIKNVEIISVFVLVEVAFIVSSSHHNGDIYTFLVKIEAKGKVLDCAGTIITSRDVLTSAHCLEGVHPSNVTVIHFTNVSNKYETALIVIHPNYKTVFLENDVAILQTKERFKEPWRAVVLNHPTKISIFSKCEFFVIVGWSGPIMERPIGYWNLTFEERAMKAPVNLISNRDCFNRIKKLGGIFRGHEKLCGVTRDEEEGDESECFTGPGGPLLCSLAPKEISKTSNTKHKKNYYIHKKGGYRLAEPIDLLESLKRTEINKFKRETENDFTELQVGVVSWGKSCSKVPSVYVKTDFYYDWISETVRQINFNDDSKLRSYSLQQPSKNSSNISKDQIVLFYIISYFYLALITL